MIVGTILLTPSNKYVDEKGNLPVRPEGDKDLLLGLVTCTVVSEVGYTMLPSSIRNACNFMPDYEHLVGHIPITPITIGELAEAELLIVSRSAEDFDLGKTFRLDKFECIAKDTKIELWRKYY